MVDSLFHPLLAIMIDVMALICVCRLLKHTRGPWAPGSCGPVLVYMMCTLSVYMYVCCMATSDGMLKL